MLLLLTQGSHSEDRWCVLSLGLFCLALTPVLFCFSAWITLIYQAARRAPEASLLLTTCSNHHPSPALLYSRLKDWKPACALDPNFLLPLEDLLPSFFPSFLNLQSFPLPVQILKYLLSRNSLNGYKNIHKPLLDPVVLSNDHPTSCFPFYFKLQEVVSLSPPLLLTLVPGFWRPHPPKIDLAKSTPTTGVKAMDGWQFLSSWTILLHLILFPSFSKFLPSNSVMSYSLVVVVFLVLLWPFLFH